MDVLLYDETTVLESTFIMREDETFNHVLLHPGIPFAKYFNEAPLSSPHGIIHAIFVRNGSCCWELRYVI